MDKVEEAYNYTYDHAGRLLETKYMKDDNEQIVLASYEYDELGRLIAKKQHNGQSEIHCDCDYNIHNWLTKIKDSVFYEEIYYNESPYSSGDFIAKKGYYNGNISSIYWGFNDAGLNYSFSYDDLSRLTTTDWVVGGVNSADVAHTYRESYSYDKHGNIQSLERYKSKTPIDNLEFTYSGNQIISITDNVTETQNGYNVKEYIDRYNEGNDFYYDANGNMTADLDRNIVAIQYNLLNLPDVVQFSNGNQIKNRYLADGTKVETHYITSLNTVNVPIGEIRGVNANGIDATEDKAYYAGNKEYYFAEAYHESAWPERVPVLNLTRVHNSEGYIGNSWIADQYYYYRKDHLGNNREVWRAGDNDQIMVQRTQYYPSGLPWAEGEGTSVQPYKYNSKEFIEMYGYDSYDYHARLYYPAIMRFNTIDPMTEKYYSISPYAYCLNNSVKYIDPDGRNPIFNPGGNL